MSWKKRALTAGPESQSEPERVALASTSPSLPRPSWYTCNNGGIYFGSKWLLGPIKNLKIEIHSTAILPIVLYRYEAWSLILR